jgi:hypothetical protein
MVNGWLPGHARLPGSHLRGEQDDRMGAAQISGPPTASAVQEGCVGTHIIKIFGSFSANFWRICIEGASNARRPTNRGFSAVC